MAARAPDFPLPDPDCPLTGEFFVGAERGELRIPACSDCEQLVWYPEPRCPYCGSERLAWTKMSGRGRLYSWTVVRHAFVPQYAELTPFVVAVVALEEDESVRVVGRMASGSESDLRCDMLVRAVFEQLTYPGVEGAVWAPFFQSAEPA
jgi:uncharacterized protein